MTVLRLNILFVAFLLAGLILRDHIADYSSDRIPFETDGKTPVMRDTSANGQPDLNILINLIRNETNSSHFDDAAAIIDSAEKEIDITNLPWNLETAEFLYLVGAVRYLYNQRYAEALEYYEINIRIRRQLNDTLSREYAYSLYNAGLCAGNVGDYTRAKELHMQAIRTLRIARDTKPTDLIDSYLILARSLRDLNDFQPAKEAVERAKELAYENEDSLEAEDFVNLYKSIGDLYYVMAGYETALVNYESSLDYMDDEVPGRVDLYLEILNNIAGCYHYLGKTDRIENPYKQGISLSEGYLSGQAVTLRQNYAIYLGNAGRIEEGREIFAGLIDQLQDTKTGYNYAYYYVSLKYADYLNEYGLDSGRALEILDECYRFYERIKSSYFGQNLIPSYALALENAGKYHEALRIIQTYFFPDDPARQEMYEANPVADSIVINNKTLEILDAKFHALVGEYNNGGGEQYLLNAGDVAGFIISLLETIRLNISGEESRLHLGDRYREFYLNAISANVLLHNNTGNKSYLDKAFIFCEKSKAAGLLAATREMKGIRSYIPEALAVMEQEIQRDILVYSTNLKTEQDTIRPDADRIRNLRNDLLTLQKRKDSLNIELERDYPEYYNLKYSTNVVGIDEAASLLKNRTNYLSYIYSDTSLYIMLVNRRYQKIITVPVDTSFARILGDYRKLFLRPEKGVVPVNDFLRFQSGGFYLYKYLVDPVRDFFISDRVIISPDNLLSFIPFEALLQSDPASDDICYGKLPYLFNDLEISYAYSITLLSEKLPSSPSFHNKAIAFAPEYKFIMDADSVLNARQAGNSILSNLPFAREEASYVAELTNGKLLAGDSATSHSFRIEAGNYDIVHLAMHALVNDREPMLSKLIFGSLKDSVLLTSDIYGIPLNVKMVFLSSCNTGLGKLHMGEGIISLARSFIYSGSSSVVMSLWEVDDRSGTSIVKSFYDRIHRGDSKSRALQKARIGFLQDADMLRSHPYFWATLVIYGDDSPLFFSRSTVFTLMLGFSALAVLAVCYFRRRRYSR